MEKPAENDHPIHELIKRRWSPRAFASRRVEHEKLAALFEAARWAASSFNEQPWRFFVATQGDETEFNRLLGCLLEANQNWAQEAPVLGLSIAKRTFTRNDRPNRVAIHDVGAAMAQLTLQALDQGLFVHQMAGIDLEKCRETYEIPDGFDPVAAFAIGYPGDPETLEGGLRESELAPRSRKPLAEVVFSGTWGSGASFG